jgi:tRNA pseudouridine55 synthase
MPIAPPRPDRPARRALHGVLLLDKPLAWTSQDAVSKARGLLRAEKAGHGGTLDPLATGLLVIAFGAATKFVQASLDADKRYLATLHLGVRTTTGDGEGDVIEQRPVAADRAAVEAVLPRFTGRLEQRPPMHSALKHEGRALYDWARAGVTIDRAPRGVTVHALAATAFDGTFLQLDVHCSKGTYVRTLAEDIGEALGCGAHLAALRRTGSGGFDLTGAATLEGIEALPAEAREALLLPPNALVRDWPAVTLADDDAGRFLSGQRRRLGLPDAPALAVYGPGEAFLGIAHAAGGELIADRLLGPHEIAAPRPALA